MSDLHCHVLPGIDDGPGGVEATLALVRRAAELGTETIIATPHVSWDYQNGPERITELVEQVNARLSSERIGIEVRPGAEIAMTRASELDDAELSALSLAGGPWLLIECPLTPAASGFEALLGHVQDRGHQIVLAHPERCPAFQRDLDALRRLVERGMLTSITAGALVGRFGGTVRRFAGQLLEQGLVHNVASDAHDAIRRPPGMRAELEQAGLSEQADWFTREVPAAIMSGGPIPPCPTPPRVRRPGPLRRLLGRA